MAYLLRKIRKSRLYKTEETAWLSEDDLQADALGDLVEQANKFSVFIIDENQSNFERVVAALGANTDRPSNIDYALFNEKIVYDLDIKIENVSGELPDEQVNNWHNDLYELSASKVFSLAMAIKSKAKIDRIYPRQILNLVANSLMKGQIDRPRIKWKDVADLNELDTLIAKRLQ